MASRQPPLHRVWSYESASEHLATSGSPGSAAYDIPSPSALAGLELVRSTSRGSHRSREDVYRGGGGLGASTSRSKKAAGREPRERHDPITEEGDEASDTTVVSPSIVDLELQCVEKKADAKDEADERAERMYARFTPRRKNCIVAIVSYAAVLAPFSSSSFLPSIPAIVEDLNTTATVINVTVAVFILVVGIFPLFWAPYAGVYGRRPVYIASLPIFALGSMGVALSTTLTALIVTRIIQGFGSCAVLSVGAGTVGDLYPRETRGTAMGWFYSGVLFGPSIAPAVAGILSEYVKGTGYGSGWRAMQWMLCAMGVIGWLLVVFALPETAHVLGIDVIRERRRKEGRSAEKGEKGAASGPPRRIRFWDDWIIVWLNPTAPLKLLARPHVLCASLVASFVLMSIYTVLVPLSETIRPRYHIHNLALFGCFYLAQGLGNYAASLVAGRYADRTIRLWKIKRNGTYVAEDRLRAALFGIGFLAPGAVLSLGWVLEKVNGKGGLAACVILLFLQGFALMLVLTPVNTYCVDVFQDRSAEVIATVNCTRYTFSAATSAFVLPMIQAIGIGWTNTFSAALILIAFGLTLLTIRYGQRWRDRWEVIDQEASEKESLR